MIKKVILGLICLLLIGTIFLVINQNLISITMSKYLFYKDGYNIESLPDILNENDLPLVELGTLVHIVGFSGKNLVNKDLSELSKDFLVKIPFDHNTKWPEENKLPMGFSPDKILEKCKDPGLGVRQLHKNDITGKGISVAVFDKPMIPNHKEFEDRINYIRIAPEDEKKFEFHFHGIQCASILAGKTVGVAPDVELYYYACPDNKIDHSYYYSLAIDKVIEKNKTLPSQKKIRIISISDYFDVKYKAALDKAENEGIVVIYSGLLYDHNFLWGGASSLKDKNTPINYEYADWCLENNKVNEDSLLIPGSYRTTASNTEKNSYIYSVEGGCSFAIPYVAGLVALAFQENKDLTVDEIFNLLHETKSRLSDKNVVNPTKFIERVKAK